MKKVIFILFVSLLSSIVLTSCSDDDNDVSGQSGNFIVNDVAMKYGEATVSLHEYEKIKHDGEWIKVKGHSYYVISAIDEDEPVGSGLQFLFESEWLDIKQIKAGYVLKEDEVTKYNDVFYDYDTDCSYTNLSGTVEIKEVTDEFITVTFNNYKFEKSVSGDRDYDKTFVINGTVKFEIEVNN